MSPLTKDLLPPSLFKCRREIRTDQIFSRLIKFIKILTIFVSHNKFIMKIDSTIYLIILIMYYKY
jgi:hypothetical protein